MQLDDDETVDVLRVVDFLRRRETGFLEDPVIAAFFVRSSVRRRFRLPNRGTRNDRSISSRSQYEVKERFGMKTAFALRRRSCIFSFKTS